MATTDALPSFLTQQLEKHYAAADSARIAAGIEAAAARPVTLRANTLKTPRDEVARALDAAAIAHAGVSWYEDAFVLEGVRERAVWDLPLYQQGGVYLQSLSSMMPPLVLGAQPGEDVLDMCAAPGGKTSEIAALTANRAHLTACEMKAPRAEKLAYNLEKLGVTSANIMRIDARRLDEFFSFDRILLDAPCTGTGTVRAGDTRAEKRLTPPLLQKVTRSQRALLDRALTVLKPGGTLVYSTCSILPEENEAQVERALKQHRDCALVPLMIHNSADAPATSDTAHAETGQAAPQSNAESDVDPTNEMLPAGAEALLQAIQAGAIPVLPNRLTGTLTICPARDYEGFFLALIKKE